MICDLCDKDQQNICERTFHFVKPINECLMRKAQENKQIIEELEKVKEKIFNKQDEFIHSNLLSECNVRYGLEIAEIIIDKEIAELKGENNDT